MLLSTILGLECFGILYNCLIVGVCFFFFCLLQFKPFGKGLVAFGKGLVAFGKGLVAFGKGLA